MANSLLQGKTVAITGAAGHIGRLYAEACAENGAASLLLFDLNAPTELAQELSAKYHTGAKAIELNLEDKGSTSCAFDGIEQLDVLVNNAAFVGAANLEGWAAPFEDQSIDTWRRALEVNLTAVFGLCQAAWPIMRKSKGSSIVNISSIYGILGPDNSIYEGTSMATPAAYAASKGGVLQLTRYLATNMAPDVRVNALALGGIERGQPESFQKRYKARTPMGRMGTEKDMVGPMLFLASDMSKYMTGQTLPVDGGWSAW